MTKTQTDVGKDTERRVVTYLRDAGWPGAERTVRTGYRVTGRENPDQGDIDGTPGITWQVKSLRPHTRMELAVPSWMAQTETQRAAAGSHLGFLVVRRWGTTNVGRWWTFQPLGQLGSLIEVGGCGPHWTSMIPVRMDMAALTGLLHQVGWAGRELAS